MKKLLIPSAVLLLGLTIAALAQSIAGGLGSQLVSAALQQAQTALSTDLNVTYRGATGTAVIAPVSSLLTTGAPITTSAVVASGSPPALTGTCTTGTQVGGNTAGSFAATCTAQTVIMTFATTAPHGWACRASDQTTPADTMTQTASSATTCTLTGTTVAADVIVFSAVAF